MNNPKNPTNNFQEICKNCGFCCDGTLFRYATINEGEVNENFEIIKNPSSGKRHFKQPCPYHVGICTLSLDTRPHVCSSFKCKLLKKLDRGVVEVDTAFSQVEKTKTMISELTNELNQLNVTIEGSIHEKYSNFKEAQEKEVGELGFRKKHGVLSIKYVALKETLDKHFRPKKKPGNDE
ncbi:hypothetical protein ACFLR1_05545 [Bacteroidota bacterium]